MPILEIRSNAKPSLYAYTPPLETPKEKEKEKVATAVLSITAKAKKRERKEAESKMEVVRCLSSPSHYLNTPPSKQLPLSSSPIYSHNPSPNSSPSYVSMRTGFEQITSVIRCRRSTN